LKELKRLHIQMSLMSVHLGVPKHFQFNARRHDNIDSFHGFTTVIELP
jgi:hypothetical protein